MGRIASAITVVLALACALLAGIVSHATKAFADPSPSPVLGGTFMPLTAALYDTRNSSALANSTWRSVPVLGQAGVPTSGVSAVAVTITVVSPAASGWLAAYSSDAVVSTPTTNVLNWPLATTSASAVVGVGSDGAIKVYARSSAATTVVIDVQGYFTADDDGTAPGGLVPITPVRAADTRDGTGGVPAGAVSANEGFSINISSLAGVPSDASSVFVSILELGATHPGYVQAWPQLQGASTSNPLYFSTGDTSNSEAVKVGSDGTITVMVGSGGRRTWSWTFTPISHLVTPSRCSPQTKLGYMTPGRAGRPP